MRHSYCYYRHTMYIITIIIIFTCADLFHVLQSHHSFEQWSYSDKLLPHALRNFDKIRLNNMLFCINIV